MINFFNLFFRFSGLGAKFLLIFYLGKELNIESLADYGLFTALSALVLLIFGFDFYNYANREIIVSDDKSFVLKNQLFFNVFTYFLITIFSFILYFLNYFSSSICLFFCIITILEHFSQDIFRLLISMNKSNVANFIFFIRNGMWVLILLVCWYFNFLEKSLTVLYFFWIGGVLISVIVGVIYLKVSENLKFANSKIDFIWIKKGLKFSFYFFMSTICFKLLEYLDRFILEQFVSKSQVACYIFYAQIINALNISAFTLIFSIQYPRLIKSFSEKDYISFNKIVKSMLKLLIVIILLFLLFIVLFGTYLFDFMSKPEFSENSTALYILLCSSAFLNFSLIWHFVLYATNNIKPILISSLVAVSINVLLNFLTIPLYGIFAASVNSLIGMIILFALKYNYSLKFKI